MTFYDDEIVPTNKIPNYLTSDLVEQLRDAFFSCEEILLSEFDPNNEYDRLVEFYFTYTGDIFLLDHALLKRKYTHEQKVLIPDFISIPFREKLSKMFFNDIFMDMKKLLEDTIKEGYVERFAFMNLVSDFQIHSDSFDVKNKFLKRPKDWNGLKKEDYFPIGVDNYPIYQGLINIDAPSNHGTIIFDQWFPYSVYWTPQFNSIETDKTRSSKKDIIFFYSDDKPSRFGEDIRNFTGQCISKEDLNLLKIKSPRPDRIIQNEYYGLSIDSVLTFNEPGNLYMWDSKKFHKTIPFNDKTSNRLVLQFMGMKKSDFFNAGNTIF